MPSSIHLTGVTLYKPEKCWGGYTLLPASSFSTAKGARLIDMNGHVVHTWPGVFGCYDNKLLPGGHILGTSGPNRGHRHDMYDIIMHDWENHREQCIDSLEELDVEGKRIHTARAHHDFQREGNPVGYYAPGQAPLLHGGMLINSTRNVHRPDLSPVPLADSRLVEVDAEGNEVWAWQLTDHWEVLGISETAKLHMATCTPNLTYAIDTHYPHLCDDILVGGKMKYDHGTMSAPNGPGLGIELDLDRVARYAEANRRAGLSEGYETDRSRPREWCPKKFQW